MNSRAGKLLIYVDDKDYILNDFGSVSICAGFWKHEDQISALHIWHRGEYFDKHFINVQDIVSEDEFEIRWKLENP